MGRYRLRYVHFRACRCSGLLFTADTLNNLAGWSVMCGSFSGHGQFAPATANRCVGARGSGRGPARKQESRKTTRQLVFL